MSRKRKRKKPKTQRPARPVRFMAGERVRVKAGTAAPDFPGQALDGWAGTVRGIDPRSAPPTYLVEWDAPTLERMSADCRARCVRASHGEGTWLAETSLEPADEVSEIDEPPRDLVPLTPPPDQRDERIRAIFGRTAADPLPAVDVESLRIYQRHLVACLAFPCKGRLTIENERGEEENFRCTVLGLLDLEEGDEIEDGLLCAALTDQEALAVPLVDVEVRGNVANRQLVEDYAYWFTHVPLPGGEPVRWLAEDGAPAMSLASAIATLLLVGGILGALGGALAGVLLAVHDGATTGAAVGATLLGLAGWLAGTQLGLVFASDTGPPFGRLFGGFWGTIAGVLLGALAGAAAATVLAEYVAALIGLVAGAILGNYRAHAGCLRPLLGAALGAVAGASGQAIFRAPGEALGGALYGAGSGAAAVVLLGAGLFGSLRFLFWLRGARPQPEP